MAWRRYGWVGCGSIFSRSADQPEQKLRKLFLGKSLLSSERVFAAADSFPASPHYHDNRSPLYA